MESIKFKNETSTFAEGSKTILQEFIYANVKYVDNQFF